MKTKYLFCLSLGVVLLALGLNFTPAGAAVGADGAGRKAPPGQTNAEIGMGFVDAAAVDDSGNLYVGGRFYPVSVPGNHIARWNGSSWSPIGSLGGPLPHAKALAVSGTNLYAGGHFTTVGGTTVNHIARWDGNSWSPLGSGMGGRIPGVNALAVSGTNLYAGGWFTTAGGHAANHIARWNGSSWSPLGSGMALAPPYAPCVRALAVSGNNLYAGGYFTTAGGFTASHIARWNGSSWSALGLGIRGLSTVDLVTALAVSGTNLYVGGNFRKAGGNAANYVAQWDGSWWRVLGSGLNEHYPLEFLGALAVSGGTLYAAGTLTTVDGTPAKFTTAGYIMTDTKERSNLPNYVAKWNGSSWSVVGVGVR